MVTCDQRFYAGSAAEDGEEGVARFFFGGRWHE